MRKFVQQEFKALTEFQPNARTWHIPFLAGLAVGIPLITAYLLGDMRSGLTASLAGLVILYIPTDKNVMDTLMQMMLCGFGMILSYTTGSLLSLNDYAAPLGFGIFSGIAFYMAQYYRLKPPGSFFFIMIASMAIGLPHPFEKIPFSIGVFSLGTVNAIVLTLIYTAFRLAQKKEKPQSRFVFSPKLPNRKEAVIIGIFMMLSIFVGKLFRLEYPYWIPISSMAVLQGVSLQHIWRRSFHRILGTIVGLGIAWAIFTFVKEPLGIAFCIISLQIIVELLITRHYALAVVFLTPMGILLAETGSSISLEPDYLFRMRLLEILIGSVLGAIGGWFLYNERIRFNKAENLKRTNRVLRKNQLQRKENK